MLVAMVSAHHLSLPLYIPLFIIIVCSLLLLSKQWIALLYPIIFCFGYILATLNSSVVPLEEQRDATFMVRLDGRNCGEIIAQQTSTAEWQNMHHDVLLYNLDTLRYHTIICRGDVELIDPAENSYLATMHNKGVTGELKVKKVLSLSAKADIPLAQRINSWALDRLTRLNLREKSFASAAAMGLARREYLDRELTEHYARSGTAHLLALSGLHLGVVLMIISTLCYLIPLLHKGHIYADIISIVAIWLFALMAGLGDSVLRAASMFSLLQLSSLLSRHYSSLNSLFAAAVVILVFDPAALYDLSFRLSFIAVAAILLVGAPLSRLLRSGYLLLDIVVSSIIIGVVATLATAPLISHSFGYISLLSPFVTLPLLLPLSVIIVATTLWVALPLPFLAPLAGMVIDVAATIQNYLVAWFASWGWGFVDYRIDGRQLSICYIFLILLFVALSYLLNRQYRNVTIKQLFDKINRQHR